MSNTFMRVGTANMYDNALRNLGERHSSLVGLQDNLTSGKVFADLDLPAMDAANDRAMICGSLAFNTDVKAVLEGFGLHEGANSDPKEFVVEKAFVGDGV